MPVTPQVDTVIEDRRWQDAGLAPLAGQAVGAVVRHMGIAATAEVVVMGCNNRRIAALNADFRGKPVPTNVLSWPAEALGPDQPGGQPHPPLGDELGDIAIAWETCAAEAAAAARPMAAHIRHLIVHATLHLLGYDHETDADAALMEGLEVEILGNLGDPSPY